MKFWLFAFDGYYPCGGWNDFHSAHTTLEDAIATAANSPYAYWHVVDRDSMQIVKRGNRYGDR